MVWTARVRLFAGDENEKRAHVTLIWDEGGPDEFRVPAKAISEITIEAGEEYLAEAIAARGVAAARRIKETQLTQALEAIANA